MFNIVEYFKQSPIVPVVFCCLLTIIILMQCFTKKRFLKLRLLFSFLLTFIAGLILVFYNDIMAKAPYNEMIDYAFLAIEILVFILLFSTIDFSLSNEKLQHELTRSLDETKYYVLLDRKDRIKDISRKLLMDLELERKAALGKNFFDVLESKYTIVGFNGEDCSRKDIKKYYSDYPKKAIENENNSLEIDICDDTNQTSAIYLNESTVFQGSKYRGRILLGEIKNEESLMGLEKDLAVTSSELDIIKSRFVTILNKTSDGIYFNNLNQKSIWFNDNLVRKLCLNGNSVATKEFLANIHPEDLALYEDIMSSMKNEDYKVTYRYNTGAYYVFVKEEGHKIVIDKNIELCGIMNIIDDYSFEKTDTVLDTVGSEPQMLQRLKALANEDTVFEVVHFKVASIPEINEKYGRAIGNMMLGHYISLFKEKFLVDNMIYRLSGLEFVGIVTNYNKMQTLRNYLNSDEKILHLSADYAGKSINLDVYMGLSLSNDTSSSRDALDNAKYALRIASNPQYKSNFAYYRDIR